MTELAPLKITRGDRVDRLSYPPHDAVTVEGPPGTEFILVCARPGSPLGRDEIAALLPMGTPWPILPHPAVVWLDREKMTLNDVPDEESPGMTRSPGAWSASAARDAIKPIEEAHQRVSSRVAYVVGAAFAHSEPDGSLAASKANDGPSPRTP